MTAQQAPWRSRILGSGTEDPTQLLANPRNWRTHPGQQRMALRGSLEIVGWVQQVLVNKTTGHVVDGHARVEEAISRGEAEVPVLYVELTEEEEALVLATLDPIAAMALPDDARLQELLADVTVDDEGLNALLRDLAPSEAKAGLTDPDDVPPLGEESNVHPGDLFALGDHRLMCGDSTKAEDVARLMGGAQRGPLVTDPPYGVRADAMQRDDRDGNRKARRRRHRSRAAASIGAARPTRRRSRPASDTWHVCASTARVTATRLVDPRCWLAGGGFGPAPRDHLGTELVVGSALQRRGTTCP